MKKKKIKVINESIDLDLRPISHEFFENEALFRRNLIVNVNEDNKNIGPNDKPIYLLNQDEVVIPDVKMIYVIVETSGLSLQLPIYSKWPNISQEEYEAKERGEILQEVNGITRGNLQWQLQNALSGLPLFDHCFPELLIYEEMVDEYLIYHLSMGS